jgi:hypothetical protein
MGKQYFDFCRSFGPNEIQECEKLRMLIGPVQVNENPDVVVWALEISRNTQGSVHSALL